MPILLVISKPSLPIRLERFIAMFPFVYYTQGDLNQPDRLLFDCIHKSHAVVLLSAYNQDSAAAARVSDLEVRMADAELLMITKNIRRFFPHV